MINLVINSWDMKRQRKWNRRALIICAIDKNDADLIFTSCLEHTWKLSSVASARARNWRSEGCENPQSTALGRETCQMSLGGVWTAASYLNLQGLHLDYRCLQFLLHFFLIKVTNNGGHSVSPAASHYTIDLITVPTLGKFVHIAVLPSSIYLMEPHLFYFTYVQTNFL